MGPWVIPTATAVGSVEVHKPLRDYFNCRTSLSRYRHESDGALYLRLGTVFRREREYHRVRCPRDRDGEVAALYRAHARAVQYAHLLKGRATRGGAERVGCYACCALGLPSRCAGVARAEMGSLPRTTSTIRSSLAEAR